MDPVALRAKFHKETRVLNRGSAMKIRLKDGFVILGLMGLLSPQIQAQTGGGTPIATIPGSVYDSSTSSFKCQAPERHSMQVVSGGKVECRPKTPVLAGTTEPIRDFYRGPSSDFYPVCGAGRVPVHAGSSMIYAHEIASSSYPRWSATTADGWNYGYSFLQPSSGIPFYVYSAPIAYKQFNRCMCASRTYAHDPVLTRDNNMSTPSGNWESGRFLSEHPAPYGSLTVGAYGTLAISKRPTPVDGSDGTEYVGGYSQCGCPNLNEVAVPVVSNASTSAVPSGYRCVPAISGPERSVQLVVPSTSAITSVAHQSGVDAVSSAMILSEVKKISEQDFYGPSSLYGAKGFLGLNLMNAASEVTDTSGVLVKSILIRSPMGVSSGTMTPSLYARGIWACAGAYKLNTNTGVCEISSAQHKAGEGDPNANIPPSEVSSRVGGGVASAAAYQATVNKGLAVCLNGFGTSGSGGSGSSKFDCYANDFIKYSSFDELWSATTTPDQGGLPFAVALRNPQGKMITGFYSLEGKHCDEFSEFAGEIQPGVLNPVSTFGFNTGSGAGGSKSTLNFVPSGSKIKLPGQGPGGATDGYAELKSKLVSAGYRIPTTPDEMRRCPILARAAFVVSCPDNSGYPNGALPTIEAKDPSGNVISKQCTAASDIKVQLRVEQAFQIHGRPSMPTTDSVTLSSTSSVSIQRILAEKYAACPEGMIRDTVTGTCKWK
jgi:hypothetical protein